MSVYVIVVNRGKTIFIRGVYSSFELAEKIVLDLFVHLSSKYTLQDQSRYSLWDFDFFNQEYQDVERLWLSSDLEDGIAIIKTVFDA